ncbi:MAG TPA: RNA polymerase sigma factor, partial [Pirellulaceae bacterium]|nr:RNA polymerase sigma factor [Pirellulaceae bacterium]
AKAASSAVSCEPATPDDEAIVARILAGELQAFELIMRRYNQRLFRVARGIVGNDDETEDVLQETYVRAFEHLRQFAGRAKFSTWLTRIAIHEALARRKQRGRMRAVDFAAAENHDLLPRNPAPAAEQQASHQELGERLTAAIDRLPSAMRVVFTMRMIENMDTREAACCLGLTEANVKVRLHRARALLRESLGAEFESEVRSVYQFGGTRCNRIVLAVFARLDFS